jgi:hypothetical protein
MPNNGSRPRARRERPLSASPAFPPYHLERTRKLIATERRPPEDAGAETRATSCPPGAP